MASMSQSMLAHGGTLAASDLLRSSSSCINGASLKELGRTRLFFAGRRRDFSVGAWPRKKVKKYEYPWPKDPDPNVKGGVLTHLSHFKPLKEKPMPLILDFEKPLMEHRKMVEEIKKKANDKGVDCSTLIAQLEEEHQELLRKLYQRLTPIQRLYVARHPNRPTFLDHVFNITEKFVELHGDRAGYDDPAIVTGLGTIDGRTYMFIGLQKGRNTKESLQRNFAMPTPHGYRKALRLMRYADHHGFPIVTFIDTPGALPDLKSEELGQGEAIAQNLKTMFGLRVPIVSILIGEGGSGGALAIGCANKLLMLENAVYYVASPEACAAILWKDAKAAPKAAQRLKITAAELCKLQIADEVIPEPPGGAHRNPSWTSQQIRVAIVKSMNELMKMDTKELLLHRSRKFRKIGAIQDVIPLDPRKKRNYRKREKPLPSNVELENEVEKFKEQILKDKDTSTETAKSDAMAKQLSVTNSKLSLH